MKTLTFEQMEQVNGNGIFGCIGSLLLVVAAGAATVATGGIGYIAGVGAGLVAYDVCNDWLYSLK